MKKINIEKAINTIFIFSSLSIIVLLMIYSINDKSFNIKHITINNNHFINSKEIENIIKQELENKNILNVNISKIKESINKNDYIQSSKIFTTFPSSIFININEITPIVLFEEESKYYLYDYKLNKIEADLRALNYYKVPIIVSDFKDQNKIKYITNSLIDILNNSKSLYSSISEVRINNNEIHYTTNNRTIIKLDINHINYSTTKLINFLQQNTNKPIDIYEYVNLIIPNQIVVKEKSI